MDRLRKFSNALEKFMNVVFILCGYISVALVILITVFLIVSGVPAINEIGLRDFLLGTVWQPTASQPSYGILPFILSSVYGTFGAMLLSVPIGILCAVYIAKTPHNKLAKVLRSAIDLLSGIPSVVYGLVGMIAIVPTVKDVFNLPDGANLLSAILVLAIMVLPSLVSISETAIRNVPKEYEEASLALGATQTETTFKVILPSAKSGIITAIVLGIGRAIGETMAIIMVSGNVANMPSLFKSVRFLTTAVASEMSYSSGLQREALFSIALVLFGFIMAINVVLHLITRTKEG